MLEPLAIANGTLKADVSDDRRTRTRRGTIGVTVARGTRAPKVTAPNAMTHSMYQRARGGRSRSNLLKVYPLTPFKQLFYTFV